MAVCELRDRQDTSPPPLGRQGPATFLALIGVLWMALSVVVIARWVTRRQRIPAGSTSHRLAHARKTRPAGGANSNRARTHAGADRRRRAAHFARFARPVIAQHQRARTNRVTQSQQLCAPRPSPQSPPHLLTNQQSWHLGHPNLIPSGSITPLASRSRNGNISSGRFKMLGMDTNDARPSCPRCGVPIDAPLSSDEPRRGRRRIWCSTACRRAAHAERAAAERTGIAVRVIEVPRHSPAVVRAVIVPRPPTTEDLQMHVLNNPDHCAWVLTQITVRARKKELDKRVLRAARELAHVLLPNATRY